MQNTKNEAADPRGELMDWFASSIMRRDIKQLSRALGISARTLSRKFNQSGDKDASPIREGDARFLKAIRDNESGWLSGAVNDRESFERFFLYEVPPLSAVEMLRVEKGITQETLADQIGSTVGAYRQRVLRNTASLTPPEYNLFLLANGLHPNAKKI